MGILNKVISGGSSLGYTPVNKAGDIMTGLLTLSGNPISSLDAATKQYVDDSISVIDFSIPIWSFQDFTNVTTISLNITSDYNSNSSPSSVTNSTIVSNSTFVVLTNDDLAYPYTSGYNLGFFKILNKVIDATNTLDAVTLSGIPDAAFKDNIRVWYLRQCPLINLPEGRILPSGNALLKIKSTNAAGLISSYESSNQSLINSIIFS